MIALEECVAVLLCAGLSRRYGPGNKLLAPLAGAPLAAHAAALAAGLPLRSRLAVVPPGEPKLRGLLVDAGFELLENPRPEAGREASLAIGLRAALAGAPAAILVLLADMPHVTGDHVRSLAAAAGEGQAAISQAGGVRSPPVLIPAAMATAALAKGGAMRDSLAPAAAVPAAAAMLRDYDRREDFDRPTSVGVGAKG